MAMTLGRKLAAGFAVAVLFLVAIGGVAYRSTARLLEARLARAHSTEVMTALEALLLALVNAETGQRGYLLTGAEDYLEPYRAGTAAIGATLEALDRLAADNARQLARVRAVKPLVSAKLEELQETVGLRRDKGFEAALAVVRTNRGKKVADEIRTLAREIHSEESDLIAQRDAEAATQAQVAFASVTYGTLLAAVLLTLIGVFVTRSITGPVSAVAKSLAAVAAEILAATIQQSSGAAESAAAVAETVITVNEVTQTADQAAQRAKAVAETAGRAAETGRDGRKAVDDSMAGMNDMKLQVESVAERMLVLSEQGQAIGEVTSTVADFAEQTNLLALNAAIEAARAGEHGRGFAVVATEVKNLADQSKKATTRVREMLGEIERATSGAVLAADQGTKSVGAGFKLVERAGETIRSLAGTIADTAQAAQQIAASAGQQAVGMTQINLAIQSIDIVTRQTLVSTRQAERAAQDLNVLGAKLRALIEQRPG